MKGYAIDDLKIGDRASFEKTVSESDVYLYAGITGDLNPAHINERSAREGIFKERIAHGMLTAGFISAVLGTKLPGPGTIYLGQELTFKAPVRFGDTIKATVEVKELIREKKIVKLSTTCTNQRDEVVLEGLAVVKAPR